MSDTSNKFSLNGLNRQKQLSGLRARRPENINQYFDIVSVPVAPTFVSILSVDILDSGSNYSKNTTISFPTPEHPNGTIATADVYLMFTKDSFVIENSGSNYKQGYIFYVVDSSAQDAIGNLIVRRVDNNGAITELIYIQESLLPPNTTCYIYNKINNSANITIQDNKYAISYILMTNFGSGYQTYNRTSGETISHNPTINSSSGSGAVLKSNKKSRILLESSKNSRSRKAYKNKYGVIVLSKDIYNNKYIPIKNFSLSDPTR